VSYDARSRNPGARAGLGPRSLQPFATGGQQAAWIGPTGHVVGVCAETGASPVARREGAVRLRRLPAETDVFEGPAQLGLSSITPSKPQRPAPCILAAPKIRNPRISWRCEAVHERMPNSFSGGMVVSSPTGSTVAQAMASAS
jgi:hypothetical protein